jgi:hypothetical protein
MLPNSASNEHKQACKIELSFEEDEASFASPASFKHILVLSAAVQLSPG